MGQNPTLTQGLSPRRAKLEPNPDPTHPWQSPRPSSFPNKSITHSAAKHRPSSGAARTAGAAGFRAPRRLPTPSFVAMSSSPGAAPAYHSRNGAEAREALIITAAFPSPPKFPSHSSQHLHVHQLLILGRSFLPQARASRETLRSVFLGRLGPDSPNHPAPVLSGTRRSHSY